MKLPLFTVICFCSVLACTQDTPESSPVLASVKGKTLTLAEAKRSIPEIAFQADSTKALQQFRDTWIERQVVLNEANRLRIEQQPITQSKIERSKNEILLQALQDFIIAGHLSEIEVTSQEAQQYYQSNKDQFVLQERHVRYRHLTAASLEDAQSAKSQLLRGISWETVISRFSVSKQSNLEESRQFWPISEAGSGISTLNRYLNQIGIQEISLITRSGNNFHFVQLMEDRAEGDHPDLEWLMDQIKDWLLIEKSRRYYNSYVKNLYLKAQANNEIDISNVVDSTN